MPPDSPSNLGMAWLGLRYLRERRAAARGDRRKRPRRKPKVRRATTTIPLLIFFATFTFFIAVKQRARTVRGFRPHASRTASGASRARAVHRPPKNWHAAAVAHANPKRRRRPIRVRAALPRLPARPHSARRRRLQRLSAPSGRHEVVQYYTVSLGHAARPRRAINATKEAWDMLPTRTILTPLINTTLPWEHVANGAAPTAPPLDRTESIFAALRKGPWMGCSRANAIVCTGVYRSLKRSAAASLFDVNCAAHLEWLPKVLDKLMNEYRLVRIICGVSSETEMAMARGAMGLRKHVHFVPFKPLSARAGNFPRADVVLAREALRGNLISTMRFLRTLKQSASARFLIHDNYPAENGNIFTRRGLRLNTALPPFSMPPPFYAHSDPEDVLGLQIACRTVGDMFELRSTPTMNELVDPRRRRILE